MRETVQDMYRICKEFHFSAAHQLNGLPEGHPCGVLHGHNYVATFYFESSILNEYGFVVDFLDLAEIKKFIDDNWDHQNLNEKVACATTSENLSSVLFHQFKEKLKFTQLYKVRVSETPKTFAEYVDPNRDQSNFYSYPKFSDIENPLNTESPFSG